MDDGIINGDGDSRLIKSKSSFLTTYPTYEDFAAAMDNTGDGIPVDVSLNTGWDTAGTPISKATLLSDAAVAAIVAALGAFSGEPVPSEAFIKIVGALSGAEIEILTYSGNGTYGAGNPCSVTFSNGQPDIWGVFADKTDADSAIVTKSSMLPGGVDSNQTMASGATNAVSWSGATVSWYSTIAAVSQLNASGHTYYVWGVKT